MPEINIIQAGTQAGILADSGIWADVGKGRIIIIFKWKGNGEKWGGGEEER